MTSEKQKEEAGDDALTDDALTGDSWILQRRKGHRFSVDDVLTAYRACEAVEEAQWPVAATRRHIDLGCGIGSVLLMVAHKLTDWRALGVEAQDVSFPLAVRNVDRNHLDDRLSVLHGDFREVTFEERADLVTGTPPYFPPGTAVPSPDSQRAYARIEYRGGVEAYLETAQRAVKPDGVVVVCGDARKPERVTRNAARFGFHIIHQLDAFPREGRASLFTVWTLKPSNPVQSDRTWVKQSWTARDKDGRRTDEAHDLRRYFGLAANLDEPASP